MNNFAIFISSNKNYLPFFNSLLNSLDAHNINVDVFLIHDGIDEKYLSSLNIFDFPINVIPIERSDFNIDPANEHNNNLYMKQTRFKYIREYGTSYKAICMLDADMFVTTPNFMNLFNLVNDTNLMIGCNERFKWTFDKRFTYKDKPLFENSIKAKKFHCSVPIIFDLNKWLDVFDFYNKIAFNTFEEKKNGEIKPAGDIYCWNISVYKNNRQNDLILFPMETMTQVHYTNLFPWSNIKKIGKEWWTVNGDEVFTIHGRVGKKSWYDGHLNNLEKNKEKYSEKYFNQIKNIAINTLRQIQKEWYYLNFSHKLNLYNFLPIDDYWETLK